MSAESLADPESVTVRTLGVVDYVPVWQAMQKFTDERGPADADEIWLLEHDPVFTQGQAGRAEHILNPGSIPVVQVDRGGQVTYHGPGQLVAYLMVDLARRQLGVRQLVSAIERAIVDVLAGYGVDANAREDAPGVYVAQDKIASLGLRVRKGRSFHGLALNINMDLEPFSRINPCGYANLRMIQLCEFVPDVELDVVRAQLISSLMRELGYNQMVNAPAPVMHEPTT